MLKYLKSFICYILTFAMLITLLPPQAYEASTSMETVSGQENDNDILQAPYADAQEGVSLGDIASTGNTSTDDISLENAQIVMELTDRRTEYSKEYKLDNGLNLAV
ncbi:MAG: hypothetical protein J6B96_02795, partial [Agathobacter sp.]|nr:hypothetical protein [Agathobacter sp.]